MHEQNEDIVFLQIRYGIGKKRNGQKLQQKIQCSFELRSDKFRVCVRYGVHKNPFAHLYT